MSDASVQDLAGKLMSEGFARRSPIADALTDPIAETPMVVTLDELAPYELDPRLTRNPRYDEIKDSIRERGLDSPPSITRRPGAAHYIIRNGGNTRLAILRELWAETRDERFFRIPCLFRPWPERGEIVALTGHLAENELHGGLSFIERALGVQKARELYEQETGKALSQSELARRLKADGYPVPQPHISRMQEAIQYLLPAIPTVLYAGLGRRQVEQLTSLRRAAERVWSSRNAARNQNIDFPTLFQDVLTFFDGAAGSFSVQRVQDELIGQMAEQLQVEYDTLAFEVTDSDKRWQLLETSPTAEPDPPTPAAAPKPLAPAPKVPAPSAEGAAVPAAAAPVPSPQPDGAASAPPQETAAPPVRPPKETVDEHEDAERRTTRLQEHIVSPAGTTERLESIQRLIADHTGEARPDFEHNVLQAIPVQVGGLYPITDIWYIEPALDDPERLRTHIAQFAQEIASEAGIPQVIEPCERGIGFHCLPADDTTADRRSQQTLALLQALSAPYLSGQSGTAPESAILPTQLGLLLQGGPAATEDDSMPARLSDNALVKLYRLLRLARRLRDHEDGTRDGDNAMSEP
ncbi:MULTISPECIES: ParB family protein [unclassified Brenneria]|uniref:ParB family protein n=1 Tax=unclassified Brenneria TaxID=2634434 RepID=UPI0018F07546|nr:ParB family protein [Brenneria sp. L3-3C-1]MBJ7223614.1 ParB family protein [Brenneria sp. L3-3C-1]MEE3644856.1 ParB family protein [Brenneria sp. L3_3C_1]